MDQGRCFLGRQPIKRQLRTRLPEPLKLKMKLVFRKLARLKSQPDTIAFLEKWGDSFGGQIRATCCKKFLC